VSTSETICLLRLSAIGDVTHALAVARQLRAARPEAKLTWIVGTLEHRLLAPVPDIEFVVFDKRRGLRAFVDLRRQLAGRRFDVLLHMQVAARANLAATCLRARRRIGFDADRSRDLHGLFVGERIAAAPRQHVLDGQLAFLAPLGIEAGKPTWNFHLTDEECAFAGEHVAADRPTLVISPCSSHRLRNWRAERYAAVADHAVAAHGFQVILSGGPSDFEGAVGHAIEAAMTHAPLNLIGRDTLRQGAALLGAADLALAPDTGPAHIANAMGTQVIGLYAASNPRRSGPYDSLALTVDRYDDACRRFHGKSADALRWGTKVEVPGAMDLITIEDVTERIDRFVESADLPYS